MTVMNKIKNERSTHHRSKVNVLITIDTETWDFYDSFARNHESAIYGQVGLQHYGLDYQLSLFEQYNLKANYFVEPLFTMASGTKPLEMIVQKIQKKGHDVQLHLHTEWLDEVSDSPLFSGKSGENMHEFTLEEQSVLIAKGKRYLYEAGVNEISAFRAGNYGADHNTLKALAENGIYQDTSYNCCYFSKSCELKMDHVLYQPERVGEVMEYPVTFFSDYPGHYRHLQVTACSFSEMESVFQHAFDNNWGTVVVVLHTFECIQRLKNRRVLSHRLDKVVQQRLINMCQFLDDHRDNFETVLFSNNELLSVPPVDIDKPAFPGTGKFLFRQGEQLYRRVFDIPGMP